MPRKQQLTVEMLQKRMDGGRLDLSALRLDQVPIELMCRCAGNQRITGLDLSNNLLASVPPQLPQFFPHISELDLNSNKIKRLPDNFGTLSNLRRLDLSHNQINKLPNSFADLDGLRWLDLSGNPLERDLADIVGKCADDAQCQTAARRAVQYVHFSTTLPSESTAIGEEINQFLENQSASSTASSSANSSADPQEVLREQKRNIYRKQHPQPQQASDRPRARSLFSRICTSGTTFLIIVAFLVLMGVPIFLTIDSMRESCVSMSAILSRTVLARRPEERRFCAQLAQSVINGSLPSPFGQFLADFAGTFRAHWSKAVNEPMMAKIPSGAMHFHWWLNNIIFAIKFVVVLCWHFVEPLFTFLSDYFNHLWFYLVAEWRN